MSDQSTVGRIFRVDPVAKPRMTQRDRWKKRASVLRYFAYRDAIRAQAGTFQLLGTLTIAFYLPVPKSWSGVKKDRLIDKPHEQRPDLSNLIKGFEDCFDHLEGWDDSMVWRINAQKRWTREGDGRIVAA